MAYTREQLEQALYSAADRYGIDRGIAWRQINQESRFNPNAVGPMTRYGTAKGIAQFIDSTAREYGLTNQFDPIASFEAWGKYMRNLLRMFGGDYAKAVASYNWGQGNVQRAAQNYGADWLSHAPAETRNYVAVIVGQSGPAPTSSPDDYSGSGAQPGGANWKLIAAFGALAVLAVIAISDD
jgi:soluble lytic murein transglycosylase-like protein